MKFKKEKLKKRKERSWTKERKSIVYIWDVLYVSVCRPTKRRVRSCMVREWLFPSCVELGKARCAVQFDFLKRQAGRVNT